MASPQSDSLWKELFVLMSLTQINSMDKLEFSSFFSDFQNSCSQPMQNPNQICSGILTEDATRKVKINPIFWGGKTLYSFDIHLVVV